MADCCCSEPRSDGRAASCTECGTAGRPVESVTVKSMLTTAALARYEHHAYRFCPDEGCSVVYFGGGDGFHNLRCPRARLAERGGRSEDGLLLLRRERSRHRSGDRAARNVRRRPARSCAYCGRSLCLRNPEPTGCVLPR